MAAIHDIALGSVFTFLGGWAYDLLGIRDKMPAGGYVPGSGTS